MNQELFQFLLPLALLFTTLVAFFVYLLIKVPGTYWLKWVGVPLFLIVSFFSYNIYSDRLGRSIPLTQLPDQEFRLLGGRVIGTERLELWIVDQTQQTRLIHIPYDPKTAKQLSQSLEQLRKGIPQMGRGKGGRGGKGTGKGTGLEGGDGFGRGIEGRTRGKRGSDDRSDENAFYDYPHERNLGRKPADQN